MPLTQEKRLDTNFANNNDHSYLHKKFKKMATTIAVFPPNISMAGEVRQKESSTPHSTCSAIISNGSIAAAHPEIEKIREDPQYSEAQHVGRNVQTNFSEENCRISNVNTIVQVAGQTSSTEEFSNKTENLENDYIRETYNGSVGGRYICPYCKLSCAKPSVLQKHIRAHTNERPYPCVPCGFAFKTKSNLYKHRRSRTHALRLQGADVPVNLNDEDMSGGSESDTSIPPASNSEASSELSNVRMDSYEINRFSPSGSSESMTEGFMSSTNDNNKSKSIYKPKFRAAFYQDIDENDKLKKSISPNADFLQEHISKIISDNEAIVDVIETPLQKKYGKIKQIAESKQFLNETTEVKPELSPLNLTKYSNETEHPFRKRSHSESFTLIDSKHPLNPEGSIIKDLLLKNKLNGLLPNNSDLIDGSLFVCPLCQIIFRSADNLETHRMYYCKGSITNIPTTANQKEIKYVRHENVFVRSNSINVRFPDSPQSNNNFTKTNSSNKSQMLRMRPENLVIMKQECNDVIAPLPSPGPLLGNTRLVDTRAPTDFARKNENLKIKPVSSPKRRIDSRSDTFSPRLVENTSPRSDFYNQTKIRCMDTNTTTLRAADDMSHIRHSNNTTSLQMFGGEVKIVDHSGGTTTLRIEPNKNQLSPILIHQNLSPSKLATDAEASSVVVRSSLHSGGTMVHNPPTPKETMGIIPQPQTPRISMSSTGISSSNLPSIHDRSHFQFPPLSAITAFNPLTLPPLSPSSSPTGATTILHGGKLIPHVPGIPGPNTPGIFVSHPNAILIPYGNNDINRNSRQLPAREDFHPSLLAVQQSKETSSSTIQQLRNTRSPNRRLIHNEPDKLLYGHDISSDGQPHTPPIPIIKVKNVDESHTNLRAIPHGNAKHALRQEGGIKRNSDGLPKTSLLKENMHFASSKKSREKLTPLLKAMDNKSEKDTRNYNFENLITKTEIYNSQIPSSSEVQKNTNAQETPLSIQDERSEAFYFQKNISVKANADDRKPKFLRPSTLPLKPGTFTPKRHHGITPNANTMPLVSPETPRPAKAYGQLYLNGNAYTYLGLKCSTKVFYCTINRPQPTYVPNQHFLSMYSNWQLLSELTPDPLGLSASSAMALYDSRHRPQAVAVAAIKHDLILTHSSKWNTISKDGKQVIQSADQKTTEECKNMSSDNMMTPKKELTGGFESNEEYTYVRGRGRGRYVCSECGIRCKKPSMLKKHIRTHTDVRPYTCIHCAFSFKTKGNLTKHMKSKAHYKKCCELGINPNEGNDCESGEMAQCSGETDDDTESDGDEGNEGETESSDTEACKSRLPEHEAAHCLLSLGGSRPPSSAAPGLITSARPTTYPYTPTGLENPTLDTLDRAESQFSRSTSIESEEDAENEPMDLSKTDMKTSTPNIAEIPTARESSVLASLASNTAKLPHHQSQWANGEPMLHTYLTERALLDSKIKQSQLTSSFCKLRKVDEENSQLTESYRAEESNKCVTSTTNSMNKPITMALVVEDKKVTPVSEKDSKNVGKEEKSALQKECFESTNTNLDIKRHNSQNSSNTENAKHVVSEYLKHARINLIKTEGTSGNQTDTNVEDMDKINSEECSKVEVVNVSESDSTKLPSLDHEPVARKVVIGVGGVAFKVTKGKDFENASYSPGRLMEDGRRVCDFCNKTFTKPSQLRLHLNIHYMERPFRCTVCAVSFRTRGHLQKHERSGSHHNKVSMTSTFGAATSFNPRPFRCLDCNIAFRIHGHLAKHLRSKMHVMRLECLFKLPFGTFTEIERAGVSLTDIDTTDCASSLASLQSLARKLHENDPTKLEYRESSASMGAGLSANKESSDDEDNGLNCENMCDSEKDSEVKTVDNIDQDNETRINYSATDI